MSVNSPPPSPKEKKAGFSRSCFFFSSKTLVILISKTFHTYQSILAEPFRRRRMMLKESLAPLVPVVGDDGDRRQTTDSVRTVARFDHVNSLESSVQRLEEVKEFMIEAIVNKCEGIMIKILDHQTHLVNHQIAELIEEDGSHLEGEEESITGTADMLVNKRRKPLLASYEPDKRADAWLKVKKDYGELGDSLDLVPIAAWYGQGRKAGWWSVMASSFFCFFLSNNITYIRVSKRKKCLMIKTS